MWVAMLALGGLSWTLEELVKVLPTIAQNPALPAWAAPIFTLAPVGIGFLMKLVVGQYGKLRTDLKIAHVDAAAAVAAGATAANADAAATLAAGNK